MTRILYTFIILLAGLSVSAQTPDQIFKAAGSPPNPKVQVSWNRYYTSEGLWAIAKKLSEAHPNLVKVETIGKTYEGRDMIALTITDFSKGNVDRKPGMYVDGNIHSNEIQGGEFAMYTAWYLAESWYYNDFIKELLADKVFYIVPTINPDARNDYMKGVNTANTPRSGMMPIDDDRDGLVDEDGYDDLNGDGEVTMMRRKNPNGRYIIDPTDPRQMIEVEAGEPGEYEMLGYEGKDNDGDGEVNEDRVGGYYDPNRDWGWNWQPEYIQRGAHKYPFSVPENRNVMEFVMKHPNIGGAQSFHNSGGMILRGPGAEEDRGTYNATDDKVYDAIGELGESIMPGYTYMVVWKDLYTAFGGELDWFHGCRGIFTFTNELYHPYFMFGKDYKGGRRGDEVQKDMYKFEKNLLMTDAFVDWKEFDHPELGKIEIGGFRKNFGRDNPGFLLENDAHRNMAFLIFHAYHTPKLVIEKVEEKDLGGGLKQVTATIANKRLIPTHSSHDTKNKIIRPDYISLEGANVVAGMVVTDVDMNKTTEQKVAPAKIAVENIPGMEAVTVRWIVSGNGKYTVKVDSEKGGVVTR
ncbi:MAG: M14 family metallopeptidase [Imperialibacter sp.]|uniref:M14 family metallopeptidase n=1 Tax=Imperialibacter sp. TaxID=2038411 RepID=UPI0032EF9CFA